MMKETQLHVALVAEPKSMPAGWTRFESGAKADEPHKEYCSRHVLTRATIETEADARRA